jgi:sulfopyruvate decarboxylase TPP-binding subunit
VNFWAFAAGTMFGWIVGVAMSHRRVRQEARQQNRELGKRMFEILQNSEVIKFTVTDEGETELEVDTAKLDEMLGNKPTEH